MSFHLDYEGFSEVDLQELGGFRYASDPSTEILCLAISHNGDGPYLWVPPVWRKGLLKVLSPADQRWLLDQCTNAERLMKAMVHSDEEIWAHNAPFEGAVTRYRWQADTGLPLPRNLLARLRCTAALCRRCGLPYSLEAAAALLLPGTKQKDANGKRLMALFSWPQDGIGERYLPTDKPAEFLAFGRYCIQDVVAETALHTKLKPFALEGGLLRSWQFDLVLNDRGFPVNVPALRNAQKIIDEVMADVGVRFAKMTGGLKATQRAKVKDLLAANGLDLPDMTADTIEETLERDDVPPKARELLETYSIIQYAAVKKVTSMLNCVCADGWIRGCLMWYGAGTGRWSGKLVQPHNFKRPTVKHTDIAYQMICRGCTREELDLLWGNALDVMSSCIRNFIQPHEGPLLDDDYNAVESRIVCWLAGQEDVLEMYRQGKDMYKKMAGKIYDRPEDSIKNPSDEREVGKRTWLGCGFQMAWEKFQSSCWRQYRIKISDDLAQRCVIMYRTMADKVVELWDLCGKAAKAAVARPGTMFAAGKHLRFVVKTVNGVPYLFMKLPSGRSIMYPWPKIEKVSSKYGVKESVTYYGEIKGGRWGRVSTYGGKLVENATQGVAFDVMSHGAANAEDRGFPIILLVHDQSLALPNKAKSLADYTAALVDLPPWADGLPIKAEGKIAPYYKK